MSERCLSRDYKVRGVSYELYVDSNRNWWLAMNGKDVDTSNLSEAEVNKINEYINDRLTPSS